MRHSYSAPYTPSNAELDAVRSPLSVTLAKLANSYTKEEHEALKSKLSEFEKKTSLNELRNEQVAEAVSKLGDAVEVSANQTQTHITHIAALDSQNQALRTELKTKTYKEEAVKKELEQHLLQKFKELAEEVGKLECSNHPTTSKELKHVKRFVLHGGVESDCGAMSYLVSKFSGLIQCSSASQSEMQDFLKSQKWSEIKAFGEFTRAFYKHEPYGDVQGLIKLLPVATALIRLSVANIQAREIQYTDLKSILEASESTNIFASADSDRVAAVERVLQCRACFATQIALADSDTKLNLYQYALAIGPEAGTAVSDLIFTVDNAFQKIETLRELLGDGALNDPFSTANHD